MIGDSELVGQPANGPLIVIIADGWTKSVYENLLDAGSLPNIADHIVGNGGRLSEVVTNIPSISIASHASILTSTHPDEHRIAAHRWVETGTCVCHNYLSLRGPAKVNRDLSPDVMTIHEAHPERVGISVQSVISRGSNYSVRLPTTNSEALLRRGASMISEHPNSTAVVWLPRGDAMGHRHGPDSRQVRNEMVATDQSIARMAKDLALTGLWESCRILLVPDHGQRLVHRRVDLRNVLASRHRYEPRVNPQNARPDDVIAMTSGDSAANIYAPADVDLYEMAFQAVSHSGVELACVHGRGEHWIFSVDGVSRVRVIAGSLVHYRIEEGHDPLNLLSGKDEATLDLSSPTSLNGAYPDFLHQYLRSHVCGRSGELLLLAAQDAHFGVGPRIGYRAGFHRGTHGGPFRDEVLVSAAYKGPAIDDSPTRSADLLTTLGMTAQKGADARVGHRHIVN